MFQWDHTWFGQFNVVLFVLRDLCYGLRGVVLGFNPFLGVVSNNVFM